MHIYTIYMYIYNCFPLENSDIHKETISCSCYRHISKTQISCDSYLLHIHSDLVKYTLHLGNSLYDAKKPDQQICQRQTWLGAVTLKLLPVPQHTMQTGVGVSDHRTISWILCLWNTNSTVTNYSERELETEHIYANTLKLIQTMFVRGPAMEREASSRLFVMIMFSCFDG